MKELFEAMRIEEILDYLDYGKALVIISLVAMTATLIIYIFFKDQGWVKYIPGFVMLAYGLFCLAGIDITAYDFFKDKNLINFIISVAGGLATLLFGLILGVYNKPRKVKKSIRKREEQNDISLEE